MFIRILIIILSFVVQKENCSQVSLLSPEDMLLVIGGSSNSPAARVVGKCMGNSINTTTEVNQIKITEIPYVGQYIWDNPGDKDERSKHYCGIASCLMVTEWAKTKENSFNEWKKDTKRDMYYIDWRESKFLMRWMDEAILNRIPLWDSNDGKTVSVDVEDHGTIVTSKIFDEDNFIETSKLLRSLYYKYSTEDTENVSRYIYNTRIFPDQSSWHQEIKFDNFSYRNITNFIPDYFKEKEQPLLALVQPDPYTLHYIVLIGVDDLTKIRRKFFIFDPADIVESDKNRTWLTIRTEQKLEKLMDIKDEEIFGWVPDFLDLYSDTDPKTFIGQFDLVD